MTWIKCSKKLPKDHQHVLVYDTSEGVCCGYIYLNSWNHHPIGSFAGDGCLFRVTHWKNLPKAPKD
jgi:hypothetical protein